MFEGRGGHELLMDAYMGGVGGIRNVYVSILEAFISNLKSKFAYENFLGFHYYIFVL